MTTRDIWKDVLVRLIKRSESFIGRHARQNDVIKILLSKRQSKLYF